MTFIYRPMKAIDVTHRLDEVRFPVMASVKHDGVRCYVNNEGHLISTGNRRFPQCRAIGSSRMRALISGCEYEVVGSGMTAAEVNGIMQTKHMHSDWNTLHFVRLMDYGKVAQGYGNTLIESRAELDAYIALHQREEGVMLRGGDMSYKHGRATIKCQRLMKVKFRAECTATVTRGEHGLMVGKGYVVTRLHVRARDGEYAGKAFTVGSGLTDQIRALPLAAFPGRVAEIEYQGFGSEATPRQPVFKRWLNEVE